MKMTDQFTLLLYGYYSANQQGRCFEVGELVEIDLIEAARLYEVAISYGDIHAYQLLGDLHLKAENHSLALKYYYLGGINGNLECIDSVRKLSSNGDIAITLMLGKIYEELNDWDNAIECYTIVAETENTDAMYLLALLYIEKLSHIKGIEKGIDWLVKAAKLGSKYGLQRLFELASHHGIATFNLAMMYEFGESGLSINKEKAFELYKQAYKLGNADATFKLAKIYETGTFITNQNIESDVNKALRYYLIAAKAGIKEAKLPIDRLASEAKSTMQLQVSDYYSFFKQKQKAEHWKQQANLTNNSKLKKLKLNSYRNQL
jgi:TPR repeat protein